MPLCAFGAAPSRAAAGAAVVAVAAVAATCLDFSSLRARQLGIDASVDRRRADLWHPLPVHRHGRQPARRAHHDLVNSEGMERAT